MKSSHALHVVVASHAMHACCPPRHHRRPSRCRHRDGLWLPLVAARIWTRDGFWSPIVSVDDGSSSCSPGSATGLLPPAMLSVRSCPPELPRRRPAHCNGDGRPEPESVARHPSDRATAVVKVGLGPEMKKMGFRFADALPPGSLLPIGASFVRLVAGRRWLPVAVTQLASVCRMEETLAGSHGCRPWGDDGAPV
ncbi:hypothetical protein ACLOJK_023434 [Asimina triloba]